MAVSILFGVASERAFPNTMRNSRTAPLVDVEAEHYCEGILTAIPAELPWWQSITVRDDRVAGEHGPAAGRGIGELRPQGGRSPI